MSKFIVATLIGTTVFDTHKEAHKEYSKLTAEYKGVFEVDNNSSLSGVNISGNTFNTASQQLKEIAKASVEKKALPMPEKVFMGKLQNGEGDYLYNGEYVACIHDPDKKENSPYVSVSDEMVISEYPVRSALKWKQPNSFGHIELDSDVFNYKIDPKSLIIVDGTTGTTMSIQSPYLSISEDKGENMSEDEIINQLKASVHRAIEMRQIAMSIGGDTKNVVVDPKYETYSFRDKDSEDVWSSPVPLSNVEDFLRKRFSIPPMNDALTTEEESPVSPIKP